MIVRLRYASMNKINWDSLQAIVLWNEIKKQNIVNMEIKFHHTNRQRNSSFSTSNFISILRSCSIIASMQIICQSKFFNVSAFKYDSRNMTEAISDGKKIIKMINITCRILYILPINRTIETENNSEQNIAIALINTFFNETKNGILWQNIGQTRSGTGMVL